MAKYRRLTAKERAKIEVLKSDGVGVREMARRLKVAPSTISRELKLNRDSYDGEYAQQGSARRAAYRREAKFKIEGSLEKQIRARLLDDWSPEQIVGSLKPSGILISVRSIYYYIERDTKTGGDLKGHLRILRKQRKDRKSPKWRKYQGSLQDRVPISERPKIVEARKRLGDIERDTVFGIKNGPLLLTMVDRTSRFTTLELIPKKCSKLIHLATVRALKNQVVRTITNDNGTEFARHKETSEALKVQVYFSKAYAAWERGTNENTNGLLRQYFPRKTDIGTLSRREIRAIQDKLNRRPRKCLNFKTPAEVQEKLSRQVLR